MLPGEDGLSICRRLRNANNSLPILMLDRKGWRKGSYQGFEVGADDYLPKPFNHVELLARIKAVMRRQVIEAPRAKHTEESVVEFGEFRLNLGTWNVSAVKILGASTSGEFPRSEVTGH